MEFNIYDMLVFEDKSGSIYQDCVCAIINRPWCIEVEANCFYLSIDKDKTKVISITAHNVLDKKAGCYKGYKDDLLLKEIWTRTDEDTYKKVYELVDGELTKISYIQGMKVYHRRQEVTYDQIKKFIVKDEESMGE